MKTNPPSSAFALPNIRRFIAFRIFFNARFYYPIFTILFLDFGLTLEQFAMLNVAWAASIVLLEVPSGALADTIGRRNLVVAAAAIMIVEMALLCFAPIGQLPLVFWLFLGNRVLSGAAEASASGADEALAYDTLKEHGLEDEWSNVLERQMRYQAIAFVIAMSLGAALYDPALINRVLGLFSEDWSIAKETAMRIPLFLTLALGICAFVTTLGMRETAKQEASSTDLSECASSLTSAFRKTLQTGKWIWATPAALAIILGGFLFDHVARMILTLNSEYYRQIELPEASFGLISAGLGMMGIFMPRIGKSLAEGKSRPFNYCLLGAMTLVGLLLMAQFVPIWGALPMILIYGSMFLTGFFVSHYLNREADSASRATVLSFKGLSYNLAYGAIGIMYSLLVASLRVGAADHSMNEDQMGTFLFKEALTWFAPYFAVIWLLVFAYGYAKRKAIFHR